MRTGVYRWIYLFSWRCFSAFVYGALHRAMRVLRSIGWRHVMHLLSCCLLVLSFASFGSLAYAEEDEQLKPEAYIEAYEEKVKSDEIIVMRGDGYVMADVQQLRSSGDDAGGSEISSVAGNVFTWVVETAITNHEANLSLMDDLAWRYYHADPEQQTNPPIRPIGNDNRSRKETRMQWSGYRACPE